MLLILAVTVAGLWLAPDPRSPHIGQPVTGWLGHEGVHDIGRPDTVWPEHENVHPRVIDGDTVRVRGNSVRLVGFDTPETGPQAKCAREERLGRRATARLHELVGRARSVALDVVPCACRPGTHGTAACNYGRDCGRLRVDGRDVGGVLIGEGLARSYVCGTSGCPRRGSWC